MMPHIAERFVQALADLPQFHSLEIKKLQRAALHLRQVFEGALQLREVQPYSDFFFDIDLSQ